MNRNWVLCILRSTRSNGNYYKKYKLSPNQRIGWDYQQLVYTTQVNSTFRTGWLANSEVISQVLFTSEHPTKTPPPPPWGGGYLYMGYTGPCRGIGYGFWGSRSLNRVSFLTLLSLCSWCGPFNRVAKLYYLILEWENVSLNECF